MGGPAFETSIFLNCPFDKDYDAILQAILFCVVYAGLTPRLARERLDSSELRLDKIRTLIEGSLYSIHDLSRCQAGKKGEHYRLNMPFELGLDYGCRLYFGHGRERKRILILEEKPYRYQAALSDLAGCDIEVHGAEPSVAVRKVRNWLIDVAGNPLVGASKIMNAYDDFQAWYFEQQKLAGFSDEDIVDYSTPELLKAMQEWVSAGRPL